MAKIKLPNYTPASGNCVQVTVECVFNFEDIAEMESILQDLQQYGAAEVVFKQFIAEVNKGLKNKSILLLMQDQYGSRYILINLS